METRNVRLGSLIWLFGACALLVFHGFLWREIARIRSLRLPTTPADLTNPVYAVQWRFLMDARAWIPDGAAYTVAAGDLDREMSLFMLSLAVYPKARALPSSYFGVKFPDFAREARFVLDEECRLRDQPGLQILAQLPGGCVESPR
jgi:hypothetical protein